MGKVRLLLLATAFVGLSVNAQVLKEDFENVDVLPQEGWEVKNDPVGAWSDSSGDRTEYWKVIKNDHALAGKGFAEAGGFHPTKKNEQWLITPQISLEAGKSYKLDMLWYAAIAAQKGDYDFQVRVQEEGSDTWNCIYSIDSQTDVENSGIKWPWAAWTKENPIINLSAYSGKKIKVAFVWVKYTDGYSANIIDIDNILIDEYTPITLPHATASVSQYIFSKSYIGTKNYSEMITLTNTGVGVLDITGIEGLDGTDFATTLDPSKVALKQNESCQFQIIYTPTKSGKASTTMTIKTKADNAELNIALSGTKIALPEGSTYEGFEGDVFPPLGWTKDGDSWAFYTKAGLTGDKSVYGVISMSESSNLITPRLDLSADKEHTLSFDFFESFSTESEDVDIPQNYFRAYLSTDGGETWNKVLENERFNSRVRTTLNLGNPKSDNCYVKWEYYTESISWDDVPETSVVYIDDVILPALYGANATPKAVTPSFPEDNAVDIDNTDLVLSWNGAQFATNYKVYLGTSSNDFNILNGVDCGSKTSCNAPRLEYNTKYYWKVVASNSVGDSQDVAVWNFTTMADQSVTEYPYIQGFENTAFDLGWKVAESGNTKWKTSNVGAYEGKSCAFAGGRTNDTWTSLTSTEFVLPSESSQVSFFWGNGTPTTLKKDVQGVATDATNGENGIDAVYFDIKVSDGEWQNLGMLSDAKCEYWLRKCYSLDKYKGKIVTFRWRYHVINSIKSSGVSLDNIKLEKVGTKSLAYFNVNTWDAGEVNYNKSVASGNKLSVINGGNTTLTISDVSTTSSNFTTDIKVGTELKANKGLPFIATFNAGTTAAKVNDNIKITFNDGNSIELPVTATALAKNVHYYSFEDDTFGAITVNGHTTIDVDNAIPYRSSVISFPHSGTPFAFVVINVTPDCADWRDVLPVSGDQVLAAYASPDANANDWIISPQMKATSSSEFSFYGKSYGTTDEYNDFKPHYFRVLVSTTDNNISSFEEVQGTTELDYSVEHKFTKYSIDLSKFVGKDIYVALQHTTNTEGYVAFFDDFRYSNFDEAAGVNVVNSDSNIVSVYPNPVTSELHVTSNDVESISIATLSGGIVKSGNSVNTINVSDLSAGMYIVTVKTPSSVTTTKIIKK